MGDLQSEELWGHVADWQAVLVQAERRDLNKVADILRVPVRIEGFAERNVGGMNHGLSPLRLRPRPFAALRERPHRRYCRASAHGTHRAARVRCNLRNG